MCRTIAAPMAAAATMAGTAAGVALALLRDRIDRRKIEDEARAEQDALESNVDSEERDAASGNDVEGRPG